MGPILLKKSFILIKNQKNINNNIKIVNLEILEIKKRGLAIRTCKLINLLSKTDDFI